MPSFTKILLELLGLALLGGAFYWYYSRKTLPQSPSQTRTLKINPFKTLFSKQNRIDQLIPQLEEVLLSSDVGTSTTNFLIQSLKDQKEIQTTDQAHFFLKKKIQEMLTSLPPLPSPLPPRERESVGPKIFFFVGVNGTGKTTTIGKLACQLKNQEKKVLVVAGDTFRAAATDQLKIWAQRSGVDYLQGQSSSDPASVVFDGITKAKAREIDFVLVDTAGRLHTKTPLMEELKKMIRVATKELGRNPDEIFLTLDATTGQNGLTQAKTFLEAAPLTGIILTKFDSTAKGGIVLAITRETKLPIRFVGVGEGIEDLREFDAGEFVEELFD